MLKRALALLLGLCPLVSYAAVKAEAAQTPTGPVVTLTWTNPNTTGTVNIYRCLGAACTSFTKIASGPVAGPYSDSTVTAGAYSYQVTAVVNGAESAPSNTASATVLPQPPTGLVATGN